MMQLSERSNIIFGSLSIFFFCECKHNFFIYIIVTVLQKTKNYKIKTKNFTKLEIHLK